MTALTGLFLVVGVALTVPVYAFGVRRLLGLRLSPLRALIDGVGVLACVSPIIAAVGGSALKHKPSVLPGVWFVILGAAIALLVGMLVLVMAEALVPSGTMPGPLYLVRGLRKRARRTRRYSQITGILVRRGVLPYLRGARRDELKTHDGRVQLARSLRLALEDGGVTFIKLGQLPVKPVRLIEPFGAGLGGEVFESVDVDLDGLVWWRFAHASNGEPGRSRSLDTSNCDAVRTVCQPASGSRTATVTTRLGAHETSSMVNRPCVTIQPASPAS